MDSFFWKRLKYLIFSICTSLYGDSYFSTHERGWHWYQVEPEPDNKMGKDGKKLSVTEMLKQYQQRLETAKAEAVLNPTSRNVETYQRLQYEVLEKSHKFADIWMQNIYRNPDLSYESRTPASQNARHVYLKEEQRKKENKIAELSQKYGLFFFFKKDCSYCEAFAPIVKRFSEKYHWEVLVVSEFGEKLDEFERNVKDNGLAETWGVSMYPALFAVNPKTGHVIPVANGMISIEEMEERITALMTEET